MKDNMTLAHYFALLHGIFIESLRKKFKLPVSASLLCFSKLLNMLVMFLPLKILFSLSMDDSSEPVVFVERYFWPGSYIVVMLSGMVVLSLLTVFIRVVQDRLQKSVKLELKDKSFSVSGGVIDGSILSLLSAWFIALLSDYMMIVFACLIILALNFKVALGYILVILVQIWVLDKVMFCSEPSKIEKLLKIDKTKLNDVIFNMFFLLVFAVISAAYLLEPFDVVHAVLILLLSRLGLQSAKSFFAVSIKFRKKFKYV